MASRPEIAPAGQASAATELGEHLRLARQATGLKLKDVAARAGTSRTTLSLLERGQRPVKAELLERIVNITGADGSTAFRLAELVPPQAATEVLGPEVARVLEPGGLSRAARAALRRVHLQSLAGGLHGRATVPPVNIERLLDEKFGIELRPKAGMRWGDFAGSELVEYPEEVDAPGSRARRNLILGHMAGHALLASESGRRVVCNHAAGGGIEAEATWIAGLMLMPRKMLESEAQVLVGNYSIGDATGLGSFIADVAAAFVVPAWLAAEHLADAGLLAWGAGPEGA